MQNHETFEHLLMKAVDKELDPSERALLDEHLSTCAQCREELADFQRIKESTDALGGRIMQDAKIIPPRESRGARRLVWLATALFLAGFAILLGIAGHAFLTDGEVPTTIKVAVSMLAVGTVLLAGLAVYQRVRGIGRDPYEEIDL